MTIPHKLNANYEFQTAAEGISMLTLWQIKIPVIIHRKTL
jgi:hypothetical protein